MSEALINHLWQSTLCALAAGLLTLAFRNSGAKVRFYIWLAASVKFLVPFSLFVWLGQQLRWEAAPTLSSGSSLSIMADQIAQPAAVMASNLAATPLAQAARDSSSSGWTIVLAIWLLGTLLLIGRRLYQWLYVRAISDAASPLDIEAPIPVRETTSALEPGVFGIFSPTLLLPAGITAELAPAQLNAILDHELCHW